MTQERRPAQHSDLNAFKDGWDEYDFADLVVGDHMWSALYNDDVEGVEDLEEQDLERLALNMVEQPEFVDHILGYVYYREARHPATSIGALVQRLTPYKFKNASPAVDGAIYNILDQLLNNEVLEKVRSRRTFQAGKLFPREEFPPLEGFEEDAQQFIRQCGGEALGRFVVLECVEEPESPYHFWAGVRKLAEMEVEEVLSRSAGYFVVQRTTNDWEKVLFGSIESRVAPKLDKLRLEYGAAVIRKPIQRNRRRD